MEKLRYSSKLKLSAVTARSRGTRWQSPKRYHRFNYAATMLQYRKRVSTYDEVPVAGIGLLSRSSGSSSSTCSCQSWKVSGHLAAR
eukprot:1883673-Rhodomonas_salina.1